MPSPLVRPRGVDDAGHGVERASGAEPVADIGALYRQHADDVARWAGRLTGHSGDVEDVVHQVFLVAQRRLPDFRGEAKVTTWLHGITIRVVQETRRRQRRWWRWSAESKEGPVVHDDGSNEDLPSEEPSALELLEKREAGRIVYQILDQLDEKYRTALILFELEGLTGQEIAALTKTSLANVWVRLLRARQQFVKRFRAWEFSSGRDTNKAKTP
jgi:RNA polymerase sigma-70 factor (ECF subfamily)